MPGKVPGSRLPGRGGRVQTHSSHPAERTAPPRGPVWTAGAGRDDAASPAADEVHLNGERGPAGSLAGAAPGLGPAWRRRGLPSPPVRDHSPPTPRRLGLRQPSAREPCTGCIPGVRPHALQLREPPHVILGSRSRRSHRSCVASGLPGTVAGGRCGRLSIRTASACARAALISETGTVTWMLYRRRLTIF